MMFEDFVNDIKAVDKVVNDHDISDIKTYIGFIEEKLEKIGRKNKDKLYSLIGEAIKQIPLGWIIELSQKQDLGYKIFTTVELFDGDCYEDVYDCLTYNEIYVVTNNRGFVKLMAVEDLEKSDQYKYIINMLAHDYDLILNNPNIADCYKEPIRKIENLFKVFGIKEN